MESLSGHYPIVSEILSNFEDSWDIVSAYQVFHSFPQWQWALWLKIDQLDFYERDFVMNNIPIDENTLNRFDDKIDWQNISRASMSEELIEKFADKLDWEVISCHQKLSESFIEKFKHKLCWTGLCAVQNLSKEFLRKHKDLVDVTALWIRKENLGEDFIRSLGKVDEEVLKMSTCFLDEGPFNFVGSLQRTRQFIAEDAFWD